jgi:hypothetical protein
MGDMRYGRPLCGAQRTGRSSSGPGTCRNVAGQGTDHLGIGCCKFHGGNTTNHRVAAVRTEATRRAATYGEPIEIDPHTALLLEVHRSAGHVAWLNEQLKSMPDVADAPGQALSLMYSRERDHMMRVAKTAIDAGVAEREVRLAEGQGRLIAYAIMKMIDELELSGAQQRRARQLVSQQLRELVDSRDPMPAIKSLR